MADYLSPYPNGDAVTVSNYDSSFTVARFSSTRRVLGDDQLNSTTGPVITSSEAKSSSKNKIGKYSTTNLPQRVRKRGIMRLQINQSQPRYLKNQGSSKTEENLGYYSFKIKLFKNYESNTEKMETNSRKLEQF